MSRDGTARLGGLQKPPMHRVGVWESAKVTGTTETTLYDSETDEYTVLTGLLISNKGAQINEVQVYFGSAADADKLRIHLPAEGGLVSINLMSMELVGGANETLFFKRLTAGSSQEVLVNFRYYTV